MELSTWNENFACSSDATCWNYWWDFCFSKPQLDWLLRNQNFNSISFFAEIHWTTADRSERLHSHRHRRPHVFPWIPRLLRRDSRIPMFTVVGELFSCFHITDAFIVVTMPIYIVMLIENILIVLHQQMRRIGFWYAYFVCRKKIKFWPNFHPIKIWKRRHGVKIPVTLTFFQ